MNLIFTNPLYLFAGALALIPLIIHLIYKKRITVVHFSSILYIEKTHLQSARKFRIREILLLIVRMAIILCLILAISQPVLKLQGKNGTFFAAESKNKKIILIMDNSASMGYYDNAVTVLEESVEKAKEILKMTFDTGDDIAVIPAAEIQNHMYNEVHSIEKAEKLLDDIRLSYSSASVVDAIKLAEAAYDRSSGIKARIFVFSDFQKSSFSNTLYTKPENRSWDLVMVNMNKKEFFNLTAETVHKPPIFYNSRTPVRFKVDVKNYGSLAGESIMEAFINDKKVSQQSVPSLQGQSSSLDFIFNPDKSDILFGRIRIDGDNLRADNECFFLDKVSGNVKVTIVDDGSSSSYIRKALDSYEYRSVVEYRTVQSARFGRDALASDIIVLSSFNNLNESQVQVIKTHLENGRALLISMENDLDVTAFNRLFFSGQILPLRALNKTLNSGNSNQAFRIKDQDFTHPLMSFFKDYDFLPLVRFKGYFKTEINLSDPGISVLAKFENGSPALLEYRRVMERNEWGNVLLFTSSLSGELNNIVSHANFPVFIFQSMKYLTSTRFADFVPGSHRTTVLNTINAGSEAKIERYDMLRKAFVSHPEETLELPGIYKAEGKYFTVNMPLSESDLTGIGKDGLKKIFGDVETIEDRIDLSAQMAVLNGGIPLALFFIILTLLLLMAEMFLANNLLATAKKAGKQ